MNGVSFEGPYSGQSNGMMNLMHQGHIPDLGDANLFQAPPYLYLAHIIIYKTIHTHKIPQFLPN